MTCRDCELRLAEGERDGVVEGHLSQCAECRALDRELAANATVLEALRSEELPKIVVRIPRRGRTYGWVAAAAAAAFTIGMLLPRPQPPPAARAVPQDPAPAQVAETPPAPAKVRTQKVQPLKIKMLTPDPDVVIYWLIDN
jgi:hypothetical protein